jgi:hypothetical protein
MQTVKTIGLDIASRLSRCTRMALNGQTQCPLRCRLSGESGRGLGWGQNRRE